MKNNEKKIPLATMGVLAPGSAHARHSTQPPINASRNFPARMSPEWPSNISKGQKEYNRPSSVQGCYIPFSLLFGQNRVNWEGRGGPRNNENSGLRLSDTICTAPLGPIVAYYRLSATVYTATLRPIVAYYVCQLPSAQRRSDQ